MVVRDVDTITQLADTRQELDTQLAKQVEDVRNSQTELTNCKVSWLIAHRFALVAMPVTRSSVMLIARDSNMLLHATCITVAWGANFR